MAGGAAALLDTDCPEGEVDVVVTRHHALDGDATLPGE